MTTGRAAYTQAPLARPMQDPDPFDPDPVDGASGDTHRSTGSSSFRAELLAWLVVAWVPIVLVWAGLILAHPYGDPMLTLAEPWIVALAVGATATAACGVVYRVLSRRFGDPIWLLPSALVVALPACLVVSFSVEGGTLGKALLLSVVGGVPWFVLLIEVVLTRDPYRPRSKRLRAAVRHLGIAGAVGLAAVGLTHGHRDKAIAADLAELEPLADAIDAFLLDRRQAPASLDELVPDYLEALPDEDFDGWLQAGPTYERDPGDLRIWQLSLELDEVGSGRILHWLYVRRSDADLASALSGREERRSLAESFAGWWRVPLVRSIWSNDVERVY